MIRKVLKATKGDSTKNYFVQKCEKYTKALDIRLLFNQIAIMSKPVFKILLRGKAKLAAFNNLMVEKSNQSQILDIKYERLEMQEYLLCGDRNVNVA